MDTTVLRNRIEATLDANSDVRRQAELDLKNVSPYYVSPMAQLVADIQ